MPLINSPTTYYPNPNAAEEVAAECQADDNEGWNYLVKSLANGRAIIEVYDETGYLLGAL